MKIATSEVQFGFNNALYCHTDSVAMDSPLGANLANIYGILEIHCDSDFVFLNNLYQVYGRLFGYI